MSVFVQPGKPVGNVFYLRKAEDAFWQGKAHEFHFREMLTAVRVTLFAYSAALHPANSAGNVYGYCQSSRAVLLYG
jgi:hypothetical protein